MGVKVKESKPGEIDIICDCGKPITQSNEYGMFCDDMCEFEESRAAAKLIEKFIQIFDKGFKIK